VFFKEKNWGQNLTGDKKLRTGDKNPHPHSVGHTVYFILFKNNNLSTYFDSSVIFPWFDEISNFAKPVLPQVIFHKTPLLLSLSVHK